MTTETSFNEYEIDLVLKRVLPYLDLADVSNLRLINTLFVKCLNWKFYEHSKLASEVPSDTEYEQRIDQLTKVAPVVTELTIRGCFKSNWIDRLQEFKCLETLHLGSLTIDSGDLNRLTGVRHLTLDGVQVTNPDLLKLNLTSLKLKNNFDLCPFIVGNFTKLIVSNQMISTVEDGTIVMEVQGQKCMTQGTLNNLKALTLTKFETLELIGLQLEITKLVELIGLWDLKSLKIHGATMFPPSRILRQLPSLDQLERIELDQVDLRGYNYLKYLIRNDWIKLYLRGCELDRFNQSEFKFQVIDFREELMV